MPSRAGDSFGAREPEVILEYPLESASSSKPQRSLAPKVPGAPQRGGAHGAAGHSAPPSKENEAIDTAPVSVQEALGKFIHREKAQLKKSEAAAAGSGGGRKRADHESLECRIPVEQPEERFARLQVEISELLDIAERQAAQRGADASREFGSDPAAAVAELRELAQALAGWKGYDPSSGAALKVKASRGVGQSTTLADSLVEKLERLVSGSKIETSSKTNRRVTWEINYAPSIGAIAEASQIQVLEHSLADIEKKLGTFEATPQCADLQTALRNLQRRVSLLDANKIEAIRGSILKAASGLKGAEGDDPNSKLDLKDANSDKQLSELHAVCHRWTPTATALPALVSRLQSLQTLHQRSADFASRLSALEYQQEELTKLLEVTNSAVLELNKGMQENMTTLKDNLQSIEAKLKARRK